MPPDDRAEWLEADGRGGFASGTAAGIRTRRYHALVLHASTPPTGRMVLVNGFDAWAETPLGTFALSTQRYAPGVLHPDGVSRIARFSHDPWPAWEFGLPGDVRIAQEICVAHQNGATLVTWSLAAGDVPVTLRVRPLMSGRDYHAMHHENGAFRFEPEHRGAALVFRPYDGVPAIVSASNGEYRHAPEWYRQFQYDAERERGLDAIEDLASPGEIVFALARPGDRAVWLLEAVPEPDGKQDTAPASEAIGAAAASTRPQPPSTAAVVLDRARGILTTERRRRAAFPTPLDRGADAYLVRRRTGRTIVAGYPWFTDWGRDTFIALRGLCLATGRLGDARDILLEWAGAVSEGMLPNRFPDRGEAPEFNAVDASLWYVVAVHELLALDAARGRAGLVTAAAGRILDAAVAEIVGGYARGTRFGIRMDDDGLLAAGVPGLQLTWMDARVGDRVITPRSGKPVEVQALWLNALRAAAGIAPEWSGPFERARAAFVDRFWNDERGYLSDVVDVDHVPGTCDDTLRPNQILAVGGLPFAPIDGVRARRIVDIVEQHLLTPLGLRSLAPGEPGYASHYDGDPATRDAVYHQGTVWPWLMGPFVEAWVRVRGGTAAARREARRRFLAPLLEHVATAGLGHVSEIADADRPWTPRGCPFQAWSLGELLRLDRVVLAESKRVARHSARALSAQTSPS